MIKKEEAAKRKSGQREREQAFLSTIPCSNFAWNSSLSGVLCGDFLEVSKTPEKRSIGQPSTKSITGIGEKESAEEILNRSIQRSQKAIRQITNTNSLYVLHTLTFAIEHPKYFKGEKPFQIVPIDEQTDREKVLVYWRQFARKMRDYEWSKGRLFRYLAVIEKHTGKRADRDNTIKTGTYHIHFLSDRIFGKRLLQHKWRHGFCNFADWREGTKSEDLQDKCDAPPPDNPGAYASKYVGKDADGEYPGRKRYWASRSLSRPERLHPDDCRALIYGQQPIYYNESEVEKEGRVFKTWKATFKIDRSSAAKGKIVKHDRRSLSKIANLRKYNSKLKFQYAKALKAHNEATRSPHEQTRNILQKSIDRKRNLDHQTAQGLK